MASSDIYETSGRAMPKRTSDMEVSQRRRRRSTHASFDEAVSKDITKTNRRRRRNSGVRRFQHLMKKPEFSRKFWTISLSVLALLLALLLIWDRFFRYSKPNEGASQPSGELRID